MIDPAEMKTVLDSEENLLFLDVLEKLDLDHQLDWTEEFSLMMIEMKSLMNEQCWLCG